MVAKSAQLYFLRDNVASSRLTTYGPLAPNRPIDEDAPGPPFNQMTNGEPGGNFWIITLINSFSSFTVSTHVGVPNQPEEVVNVRLLVDGDVTGIEVVAGHGRAGQTRNATQSLR